MDSLAFLASDIVLCDEVKADVGQSTFAVVEVFKGDCKPKQQLTVEVDSSYTRQVVPQVLQKDRNAAEKVPLGRVLLFLKRAKAIGAVGEVWRTVLGGVKLVVKGEVYCYGQFRGNPGALYLARMAPENIKVPDATPYDEKLLVEDLKAALKKAEGLKEPEFKDPLAEGIVRPAPQDK
ncbi:hypothetical protein GobsT_35710 [Gemmata obscuriglobus]|uniref:Uncharacterized protein n=1 Tax=Gemmata obscuriglobus TaxID=114 RepID=A0A2Z3H1T8_9BACT|nr:hypothetical protein [Gemmata obscuriglobus]AWM38302.1 hypothetical protein C1280_15785 [Gemmata obscuriglobus]QEG28784.1 hypothetical protein GobsT_35710 [Gemmata obscuriglobus]VTS07138.1 unnamed protein product [Gemmata obscuriglobus UQM 2246]